MKKIQNRTLLPERCIKENKDTEKDEGREQASPDGRSLLTALIFFSIFILLYAPFWQQGAILNLFHTNPSISRDINTLAEFVSRLYNGITGALCLPLAPAIR